MKKLLCVICLLAAALFVDTASACVSGRCGSYYRTSYGHSYGRHFRVGHHYGRGFRAGRRFGHRFGRRIGFRAHRVSYCSYCGR